MNILFHAKDTQRKYKNRKVEVDGFTFDSQKEANRYGELKLLERAGEITHLELQPKFEIIPTIRYGGKPYSKIHYIADFAYNEPGNTLRIVEEVKGKETEGYRLKIRLFLLRYFVDQDPEMEFRVIK